MLGTITSELITAYEATHYRVTSLGSSFVLRIGQHSPELLALYRDTGCTSAALITAWNPYSESLSSGENEARQRRLISLLAAHGLRHYASEGVSADGTWREPSLLIMGVDECFAAELAKKFEQNALVYLGTDAVSHLILCNR